jgi:DNA helicase HerA-like ATPase
LVFSNFELNEFKDIEGKVHEFISGDDFTRDFLIKFAVIDFYVFSFAKSNIGNYIMSVLADGVLYDVLVKSSNGSMEIAGVEKSPGINL